MKRIFIGSMIIMSLTLGIWGYSNAKKDFIEILKTNSQSLYLWNATMVGEDELISKNREVMIKLIENEPLLKEKLKEYEEYRGLSDEDIQNLTIESLKDINIDTVYLNAGYTKGIYKKIKHEIYKDERREDKKLNNEDLLSDLNKQITGEKYLRENHEKYNSFIKIASQNGIKVEALYGTPEWALEKNYESFKGQVKDVLNHNKDYKEGRFTAVHLDIEPHGLKEYKENKKKILDEYVDNLKKIKKLVDKHNKENNDELHIVIDIPISYEEGMITKLLDNVDEIVVMNYFNKIETYKKSGQKIMSIVDEYNKNNNSHKKVKIASEFQPYEDLKYNTLYHMNKKELRTYFNKGIREFEKYDCYDGVAMHEYEYYREYLKKMYEDQVQ
ncbi:hypothetical protein [Oceanirhabdus seepicola]|uniref:Uncharacterized protein n=1 Tax=Oceanirhabdus seepicola TaxID=2828781 RepID=A0A9J6NZ83_9CLOT|nr:hypothetical protein [Oceanirhabdus seepicola]MCM1989603.1 hypothetical protein [Oceanirhabdus seepicola]